ncbi:DUF2784 domain-containing protein [Candidatus Pelagibacter sp. HIMB109]|uniref:DUF2784 domain-containing protein n=1 Tax=Candidatus Pelagibacter sp. HIMB109 TaxID=3415412 RepID=UPI003F875B1D
MSVFEIFATIALLLHFLFILFVIFGAILILKFKKIIYVHIPAVAWGAYIELSHSICPLTHLENFFLKKAGKDQYSVDFIENYIFKIIYPPALNYEIQTYLGVILIFVNLLIYYYIVKKIRTGG